MTSIRKIAVPHRIWLSTFSLLAVFSFLAVTAAGAQEPVVKVDADGNTTVSGNLQVAGGNHDLNVDGKISAKGDTTVGGNLRLTGTGSSHDLNVDGNIRVGSTHLIYNSQNGVIDWGSNNNGTLYFRTVPTQGDQGGQTVDRMTISSSGAVNIPGSLNVGSVSGDISVAGNVSIRTGHLWLGRSDYKAAVIGWQSGSSLMFRTYDGGSYSEKMVVTNDGRVGIGTSSPTRGQLEVVGSVQPNLGSTWEQGWGNGTYRVDPGTVRKFSIFADNAIAATTFNVHSDARIKKVQGRSDGAADLKTLLGIEIADYHYIDTASYGDRPQKKAIAQQVETVFPQAVSKHTDVVPDIYQPASLRDGWVELATDLKKGDRVKLIGEDESGVYAVLAVQKDAFQVDFKPKSEKIFVYGREVNDYRTVDYDAIAMLNVSATQQIKKETDAEVNALKAENEKLRECLVTLEARDKERDAQLKEIQNLLSGSDHRTPKTPSNQAH
jgi:Chaperone of endosialidase